MTASCFAPQCAAISEVTSESTKAVYAALVGNVLIAATKLVAATITGSSSMLSEAFHSMVDSGNEVLLLYGQHRADRAADEVHPLGYGRELYFWAFVVALLIFALGAGLSVYEGITHIRHPEPIKRPMINYAVLALAALFEGGSLLFAWRAFRANQGDQGFWQAVRRSKDPASFMVLFEDSAALIGIALAALGTFLAVRLGDPRLDGAASILIGVLLAAVAVLLARETKGLLIGERAAPQLVAALKRIAGESESVRRVAEVVTVHLAPEQVAAILTLELDARLRVDEVERLIAEIERRADDETPEVVRLYVRLRGPDP